MPATFYMYEFASPAMRDLVRSAWSVSYDAGDDAMPGLIAPDAHVELVFQTGEPCGLDLSGREYASSPRAMLYALRRGVLRLHPRGANTIAAIRVAPAVASAILGRSLVDLWNEPIDLSRVIGAEADELVELLARAPQCALGQILEAWLIKRLVDWDATHVRNHRLQNALFWKFANDPVAALADKLGVTSRTLRRHCERHAGLSPKQISLSGRILRSCIALRSKPELSLAVVASDLGFGDQSAFTNTFGHFVTMTPSQFRAEPIVYCEGAT